MQKYFPFFMSTFLLIFVVSVFAEESTYYALKYHFLEGRSYKYHIVSSTVATRNLPDDSFSGIYKNDFDCICIFEVNKIDTSGNANITVRFESLKYFHDEPFLKPIEYDVSKPFDNFFAAPFKIMATGTFKIKLFPNGDFKLLEGYRGNIESYFKKQFVLDFPKFNNNKSINKMIKEFSYRLIGDKELTELFQDTILLLPKTSIKINDSWGGKYFYTSNIPYSSDSTFTLKKLNQDIFTIEIVSKIISNAKAPLLLSDNYIVQYELTGKSSGVGEFSRKNSLFVKYQKNTEYSGLMKILKGPKESINSSWPFIFKDSETIQYME